jgi:hypothetical protein
MAANEPGLEEERLKKLLTIVIHNLQRKRNPQRGPLWATVADYCGLGSASAAELCRKLGFDPDAYVG